LYRTEIATEELLDSEVKRDVPLYPKRTIIDKNVLLQSIHDTNQQILADKEDNLFLLSPDVEIDK